MKSILSQHAEITVFFTTASGRAVDTLNTSLGIKTNC